MLPGYKVAWLAVDTTLDLGRRPSATQHPVVTWALPFGQDFLPMAALKSAPFIAGVLVMPDDQPRFIRFSRESWYSVSKLRRAEIHSVIGEQVAQASMNK